MKIDSNIINAAQSVRAGDNSALKGSSVDFKTIMMDALGEVNQAEKTSQAIDEMLAVGEVENLHELRIEAMKADITLSMAVEVRNKVMDAYNEIMRLQF